jgi:acetyl esterase
MSKDMNKMKLMKRAMAAMDKPRLALQGPPKYDQALIQEIFINEETQIKADLIRTLNPQEKPPTCIMIHGGGLFYGSKELNLHASVEMAKRGFNVVNVNYPLLEEANLPEQISSLLNTFKFIQENHKQYQLNIDDVVMMGDSAGAYLSLMSSMLMNRNDLLSEANLTHPGLKIKAIGLICIMVRIKRDDTLSFLPTFAFNTSHSEKLVDYLSNPLPNIKDAPPCFVIGSEEDFLKQDTLDTIQACVESRHLHETLFFNKGSSKPLFHVFPITFVHFDESQHAFNELSYFFNAHLHPII